MIREFPVLFRKKEECCGCSACYSVCPNAAITMNEDVEGFFYPRVDEEKCLKCYKCIKVCPLKSIVL